MFANMMLLQLNERLFYQQLPSRPLQSDSKASIAEDYKSYLEYYSTDHPTVWLPYQFRMIRFLVVVSSTILLLFLLIFLSHKGVSDINVSEPTEHIPTKTLGGRLYCDREQMKPSVEIPDDVNKVRPADLKVIAAMGDSIMVASLSKNFEDDTSRNIYLGNSFVIGGDGTLAEQITVGKIVREFNRELVGLSHGAGYDNAGFNVAVGGMTSEDMPRQAKDLIERMKRDGVSLTEDWKIVTIFIGTNDIAKLRCYSQKEPIERGEYKRNLFEAISLLRGNLNRTIVSVVSMWNSQLVFDAQSLIEEGKRMQCGDHYMEKRDVLCDEYRKVAYEVQNERAFDHKDFTVVVQGFMDNIRDAFRNKDGMYDKSFYGEDMFHLSKYGNAVLGKFLWNTMLEPVDQKSKKVDLGDESVPLKCPTKDRPYIQTLGNR
ncbi:hypothetical protein RB195_014081 [Necator americanus]|uniref:GDSL-like protein n=1 Tax=Necator americanus TaxID=51031 RepID=A0ABR1DYI6_NECAM